MNPDRSLKIVGNISATGCLHKSGIASQCVRHRWNSYAIVYLVSGTGWFESAPTGRRAVKAGDAIVLFPKVAHRYGPQASERWQEYYVTFSGPVFDAMTTLEIVSPAKAIYRLTPWHSRMEALTMTKPVTVSQKLAALCSLQTMLLEMAAAAEPNPEPEWLCRTREAIATNKRGLHFEFQAQAATLGMSYESFRKRFRELTGQSPAHYLTAQVMSQACNLLYAGNLQIKEIAGELGFCDEYHFSKRFKQWYGQAPSHHASTGMKRS